ncbi:methyltransferase domain-containing protein [Actinomadura sp. NAK00032]|uniref:class I SAM-dependent methyltransferase n=1 Tax=Actinomadura sp. NAK00032 TaxID=2742128 RepID=UPI00159169C1|nr:methyltransferase domain-containing protein [Actinomadura sp. NAK00032]QKW37581.1 methyltransferase domain-containing protein [Actinomadura sp. NAK00032]
MGTKVNAAMADHWNGDEGVFWAEEHERWDHLNSAFNDHMFTKAAITPGDRVLDIGCGNGQTSRLAARRAFKGHAVGFDISAPMLERARALAAAEGVSNVEFAEGDAQVHPFAERDFDVVISRFGLTFFDDPHAAMVNIARTMRPGGRLSAIVHGDVTQTDWPLVFGAIQEQLALPWVKEPKENPMADPERMGGIMADAGFTDVAFPHVIESRSWGKDAEDVAGFLLNWTPMRISLSQVSEEAAGRARQACIDALRPFETADGVVMRTPAWVLSGTLP